MYFDQTEFGKRLHDIRVLRGLTQEALAEKVSVEKQHNQIKWHKVDGDPPGQELRSYSYSIREMAELLSVL